MRGTEFTIAAVVCATLAFPLYGSAQDPAPPTIHRVTLQPDAGVLTISGTGLGPDLFVSVDGQSVTVLPGASDTQVEVMAPATVLTMAGTYRLTVVDRTRQVGDAFVVASQTAAVAVGHAALAGTPAAAVGSASIPAGPAVAAQVIPASRAPVHGPAPLVIEDSGAPFRTALGSAALGSNTTGSSNTASGFTALTNNTTGSFNTAHGTSTLVFNTTGEFNTAIGREALYSNTGSANTASGHQALRSNSSGSSNTASGNQAAYSNTTGIDNTATGAGALFTNTAGIENTATGKFALANNTTASGNTASGASALASNTTGGSNTADGAYALWSNTTGFNNMASGVAALRDNTTGGSNTAIGVAALRLNTGQRNTAIGTTAGANVTTGSYNIFLGAEVFGTAADTNTIRIGKPYLSGGGQNQAFIAGIRGTAVTGGEVVFIDAVGKLGSGAIAVAANSVGSAEVIDESLTASDLAPNAVGTSELAADAVTAAQVAFNYAASATEGGAALDVACVGCVASSEVGFSFASLGANTFTGTQTIGAGNLDLVPSTTAAGNVTKSGVPFLHNVGTGNTFLGLNAGPLTLTGTGNTGTGAGALGGATTGNANVAVGRGAGANVTTGSHNVLVGTDVAGTGADANTIRIGLPYDSGTGVGQNQTFIAGVWGNPVTGTAAQVFVDANGKLGTGTPVAILSGTATLVTPAAVQQQLQEQQAINAEQQATNATQQATISALQARLVSLEALVTTGARRK